MYCEMCFDSWVDSNDEVDCYSNTESVTRTMREVSEERRQQSE